MKLYLDYKVRLELTQEDAENLKRILGAFLADRARGYGKCVEDLAKQINAELPEITYASDYEES